MSIGYHFQIGEWETEKQGNGETEKQGSGVRETREPGKINLN